MAEYEYNANSLSPAFYCLFLLHNTPHLATGLFPSLPLGCGTHCQTKPCRTALSLLNFQL